MGATGDRWLVAGKVARDAVGVLRHLDLEIRAAIENKQQAVSALC